MLKTICAILGIILCISGIIFYKNLQQSQTLAVSLDGERTAFGIIDGPPPCTWESHEPERVMSENKSQAVVVTLKNETDVDCESYISLNAPGFDSSPRAEEQYIAVPPKQDGSLSWILVPRKTGTYDISVSDTLNTKIFGVTVTNTFGLSAVQAKIASVAGTIFGPMLTVPWLWEKLWKRRKNKNIQIVQEEKNN